MKQNNPLSFSERVEESLLEESERLKSCVWVYNSENMTIFSSNKNYYYEIDIERCTTSAEVLDWIFQVHS